MYARRGPPAHRVLSAGRHLPVSSFLQSPFRSWHNWDLHRSHQSARTINQFILNAFVIMVLSLSLLSLKGNWRNCDCEQKWKALSVRCQRILWRLDWGEMEPKHIDDYCYLSFLFRVWYNLGNMSLTHLSKNSQNKNDVYIIGKRRFSSDF